MVKVFENLFSLNIDFPCFVNSEKKVINEGIAVYFSNAWTFVEKSINFSQSSVEQQKQLLVVFEDIMESSNTKGILSIFNVWKLLCFLR